jgi:hypothetical protein
VQAAERLKRRRAVVVAGVVLVAVLSLGMVGTGAGLIHADRARRAEADERANAERERDQAEKARAAAAARLDTAARAVERSITRVGEPRWATLLELQAERRAVLADAIAFLTGLGPEEQKAPAVRRQLARAHLFLTQACMSLSDFDAARANAATAQTLYAALAREFPRDADVLLGQIEAVQSAGHVSAIRAEFAAALGQYEEARSLARAARAADTQSAPLRLALADVSSSLAPYYSFQRPDLSRKYHAEALAIGDEVRAADPTNCRATLVVILALVNTAIADLNDRPADAAAKFDRARDRFAELDKLTPPTGRALDMATSARSGFEVYTGLILCRAGRAAEGLATIKAGVNRIDRMVAVQPKSFPMRVQRLQFRVIYVDQLLRAVKLPEAEAEFAVIDRERDALIKDVPAVTWVKELGMFQLSLLDVERGRAGEVEAVQRLEDALLRGDRLGPTNVGPVKYNLACARALLAGHRPEADRAAAAARAGVLLNDVLESGYFAKPTNNTHIDVDTDFDPIRKREVFRAFMVKLRAKHPLPPAVAPPPRRVR